MLKNPIFLVAIFSAVCACSGSADKASTTQAVTPSGATLTAGAATLTIPAGALPQTTDVTLREAEPRHQGRSHRIEVEPHGRALGQAAHLSVRIDDSNVRVKMHDGKDELMQVEVEDRNHGAWKTDLGSLDDVEVELEHGAACTPACATGQECDDGVCKAHVENASAKVCAPVCASGEECDDGVCKAHSEVEGGGPGGTAACVPACATGLECDDGICKVHK